MFANTGRSLRRALGNTCTANLENSRLSLFNYYGCTHASLRMMHTSPKPLENQSVFVTGGSRGLGFAIVDHFVSLGASVVFCATSEDNIQTALDKLTAKHPSLSKSFGDAAPSEKHFVHGVVCDVSDYDAIARVCQASQTFPSAPNVLVNAAGICVEGPFIRAKMSAVERMFAINVLGAMSATKAFLRHARPAPQQDKPAFLRVVSLSSVVARGAAGLACYSASKGALESFSKSLTLEMPSLRGVPATFNVVAPGYIETDMTAHLSSSQREAILARVPGGKMGSPTDVAATVAWLCSPEAGYVNGQVIGVDGGMM